MRLVNETPFAIGYLAGRLGHPAHSVTIAVKGTFRLVPGSPSTAADEPLQMAGDDPDEEDGPNSLRYPLDLVPFKPKADLLLVGKCHAGPRPVPRCPVSFAVGSLRKTLAIVGDRHWLPDGRASEPVPFTEMDLVYERSFGGPGHPANPVGRGLVDPAQGQAHGPLPNIEVPAAPLTHPSQRPPSAGFGPLRRAWKPRCDKLGTYDAAWRERRWPWFPADFDFTHFNAAPEDMQVPYLRGDEPLRFEHLHPTMAVFESMLPGLRVRCLARLAGSGAAREVPLAIDTLWIDMEAQTLVLLWRGATEVASRDADEEIEHLFVASEPLHEPAAPGEALAKKLDLALAPAAIEVQQVELAPPVDAAEEAKREAEFAQAIAEAEARTRAVLLEAGLDPDHLPQPSEAQKKAQAARLAELGFDAEPEAPPPPWTRERVAAAAQAGESMAGADLSGLDLSELDLAAADFSGAQLSGAKLRGARAPKAKLDGATLEGADLTGVDLRGASLAKADLTSATLERANLVEAVLEGAIAERVVLRECRLAGAHARGLAARQADFAAAVCAGADFTGANLAGSRLDGGDWRRALLCNASLHGCSGEDVDASEADLTGLRASEGVAMPRGRFAGARADGSNWRDADLSGADLSRGSFQRANFSRARLDAAALVAADFKQAKLARASLRAAKARGANLFQADLERANLAGADFTEASLYGAETWDAVLDGTILTRANVKGTKLAQKSA